MAYAAELCGSKLREKLSSTLNESSATKISSNSFAARQMAKMGWTEGTGLGKKRDGIVSHIKVQKREENVGLGVEKERAREMGVEGMWWSSSVADTLSRLQQKKSSKDDGGDGGGDKSKKKKNKKEKKSKKNKKEKPVGLSTVGKIYTEDELFIATGGARFGTKGGKRAEGKWQRSEKSKELKEWEEQVKDKVEWNGLGKANVILSDTKEKKSRKRKAIEETKPGTNNCENENNAEEQSSDTKLESNDGIDLSKSKKKRKKEKKSKKKKEKQ